MKRASSEDERYKVPYAAKMAEWEDKDSDADDESKNIGVGDEEEEEYDMFGNKKEKTKEKGTIHQPPKHPGRIASALRLSK